MNSEKPHKPFRLPATPAAWKAAIFTAKCSRRGTAWERMGHTSCFCLISIFSTQWNRKVAFLGWFAGCLKIPLCREVGCPALSHVCLQSCLQGRGAGVCPPLPLGSSSQQPGSPSSRARRTRVRGSGGHGRPWSRPGSPPMVPHHVPPQRSQCQPVMLFLFILGDMRDC